MLSKVKEALRISNNIKAYDNEINLLINASIIDLKSIGIKINTEDVLIQIAIITYCKAHFGIENKEAEYFTKSYNLIKTQLSLTGEYK